MSLARKRARVDLWDFYESRVYATVDATVLNGSLAVHRSDWGTGWKVTHVKTGCLIPFTFRTRQSALAAAAAALRLRAMPWDKFGRPAQGKRAPGMTRAHEVRIKRTFARHGGRAL